MATPLPRLTLVIGGARSGKSRFAEGLATAHPAPWIYVATAEAHDDEMADRITHHRSRRAEGWTTIEAPRDLAGAILAQHALSIAAKHAGASVLLIDCLTLWLTNVMLGGGDVEREQTRLLEALASAAIPVIAVSNEVGMGIVPDNALARAFRDAQGRLNAAVAQQADHVVLMAAGLPLTLKAP
ncbi:bifunctional adenosylcobinamide kinase/adenosylcobinamide-phosphate guanylyltransferase [Hyphomicrobium sp.]|uniref:bifunctional adenosylcobinamide kinase/adenosylcobinamide-phosphate guanylyltransferase n=1 Tax=Hyphomicrobium sp. TaxID=82 RepID=UPI003F723440